jgi:hypothetical protein
MSKIRKEKWAEAESKTISVPQETVSAIWPIAPWLTRADAKFSVAYIVALTILSFPGFIAARYFETGQPPLLNFTLFLVMGGLCAIGCHWGWRLAAFLAIQTLEITFLLPNGVTLVDLINEGFGSIRSIGIPNLFALVLIVFLYLGAAGHIIWSKAKTPIVLAPLALATVILLLIQLGTKTLPVPLKSFRSDVPALVRVLKYEPELILQKWAVIHHNIIPVPASSELMALHSSINHPVLAIVVESWGVTADRNNQKDWRALASSRKCESGTTTNVKTGLTSFPGYTVQMEVQQLCAASMPEFTSQVGETVCLPRKSQMETYAYHNNGLEFYRRDRLYKQMGFQHTYSTKDMGLNVDPTLPFTAANDEAVSKFITANAKNHPGFHYWMTMDMHSPYDPSRLENKPHPKSVLDKRAVYQTLRNSTLVSIEEMIRELPEYDVYIVGDHAPKFFDLENNAAYDRKVVPYIDIQSCV